MLQGMFLFKTFYWGQKGARDNYSLQICTIVENGYRVLGEIPVIIGVCGIPMDYVLFVCNITKADCSKATVKHSRPTTFYGKLE